MVDFPIGKINILNWVWLKIIDPNGWFPTNNNHFCGLFGIAKPTLNRPKYRMVNGLSRIISVSNLYPKPRRVLSRLGSHVGPWNEVEEMAWSINVALLGNLKPGLINPMIHRWPILACTKCPRALP